MTLAAVDRLVHHATSFEMNVESYRRRVAAAHVPRKSRGASDSEAPATYPIAASADAQRRLCP